MGKVAKFLSEWLPAIWRRTARYFHLAIILLFVIGPLELIYEFLVSQQELGFPTVVGLIGLFWVLLAAFVLCADGMDVIDRIVDWFQPESSSPEPEQRKSQSR